MASFRCYHDAGRPLGAMPIRAWSTARQRACTKTKTCTYRDARTHLHDLDDPLCLRLGRRERARGLDDVWHLTFFWEGGGVARGRG